MGFLTMKLWECVASAFRLFFSEFSLFCQNVNFFHSLNRNDYLKESGVGVGLIEILGVGVGVGVGILGKLGVGVGPCTFRLRNPAHNMQMPLMACL